MSVALTVNGAIFNYPQNFDTNWGIDATGWAQAVTSGMLQKGGGSFPLTADVDFGASFGLKAAYFETRSANPATSGTIRLSSADPGIAFRNNANNANLLLTTDSSDDLVWSSNFLLQNTNSIKLQDTGNVHTISLHSPSTATTYSFVLPPNTGSSGQVLQTDGTGNTSWVNASGTGTVNSGTAGNFSYYATSTNAVSDSGVSSTAPVFTGMETALTHKSTQTTNQLSFTGGGGGNQVRTLNVAPTTTVGEIITVPDSGGSDTVALLGNAQTFTAHNTFSGQVTVPNGSAPSDAAAFGQIPTAVVPTGAITMFGGSSAPSGWLLCDGTSYTTAGQPALFAVIGYTFGGAGANFNVPNMVNNVPIGAGSTAGLGTTVGSNTVSHTHTENSHTHTISHAHTGVVGWNGTEAFVGGTGWPYGTANVTTNFKAWGYADNASATGAYNKTSGTDTANSGTQSDTGMSTASTSTLQPSLGITYIIKA